MNCIDNKVVFADFYQQDITSEAILLTLRTGFISQEYRS